LLGADHHSLPLRDRAQALESRGRNGGGEQRSIVKFHSRAKLEFPALEIGVVLPGGRQRGLRLGRIVESDQRIEHQVGWNGPRPGLDAQRAPIVRPRSRAAGGDQASGCK